jgi:methionyl-tRNA synthetase
LPSFKPEDIVGKKVTVLVNLAPRNLRGVESQGMILMTTNAGGKLVLSTHTEAANGDYKLRAYH